MLGLPLFALIINGVLLIITIVLAFIMLRAGALYSFNIGDFAVQKRMQWIILRVILALVVIGLIASVFNLFFA